MTEALALELVAIDKSFGGVHALRGADLGARPGEILGLCGENGAGKSTLLKVLSGVYPATSYGGSVRVRGEQRRFMTTRDAEHAGIAIVHQELMLVPELPVSANLVLGRESKGVRGGMPRPPRPHRRRRDRGACAEAPREVRRRGRHRSVGARRHPRHRPPAGGRDCPRALPGREDPHPRRAHRGAHRQGERSPDGVAARPPQRRHHVHLRLAPHGRDLHHLRLHHRAPRRQDRRHRRREDHRPRRGRLDDGRPRGRRQRRARDGARGRARRGSSRARRERAHGAPPGARIAIEADGDDRVRTDAIHKVSLTVRPGEIVAVCGAMGSGRTALLSTLFGCAEHGFTGSVRVSGKDVALRSPRDAIAAGIALDPRGSQGPRPRARHDRLGKPHAAAAEVARREDARVDRHHRRRSRRSSSRRAGSRSCTSAARGRPRSRRSPAAISRRSSSASGSRTRRRCSSSTSPRAASTSARARRSTASSPSSGTRAPPSSSPRAICPRSFASRIASSCSAMGASSRSSTARPRPRKRSSRSRPAPRTSTPRSSLRPPAPPLPRPPARLHP